ncbi:hypothetical protein Tco_1540943 [Tanacetum coccineum]
MQEATIRRDLQLEDADGINCLLNATIFEQLTLMGMMKNLDSAGKFLMYPRFVQVFLDNQLEGMLNHNRIYIASSHTKKVFANIKRKGKDFSGRVTPLFSTMMVQAQQEQGEADEAVYEERDDNPSKATPNEPSSIGTSSGGGPSAKDTWGITIARNRSLQLKELIEFCTKLQQRVLDLENIKTAQAQEITSLKKRVKKLERKKKSRTYSLKRLYKVGLSARIDSSDDEASLGDQEDASKQGRKIHDIDVDEDITLENVHDADMFGVHDLDGDEVFVETEEPVVNAATTISTIPVSAVKDLSNVDMTLAQALAELKSTKPKAVTTAAITNTTAVTRHKAKGLVIQEQEQAETLITSSKDKERIAREKEEANAALIAQWNDIHDKVEIDHELAQRLQAEEQEELTIEEKSKLFQQLLDKRRNHFAAKRAEERRNKPPTKAQQRSIISMKRANTFVDMDIELVGGSEVREEGSETKEESSSKRADDGDDVTIEATPLSTKSPTIVDYKIYKEGKKSYFQIIRADGTSQMYLTFGKMLKNFDREDLTMFDYHLEDSVWKNQQGLVKVLNWKLYDSCGVYCVTMQNILYYLLVEKMYPLTKHTLHQMFNDVKLQVDYECKMEFKLLRLVKKQLKEGYGRIVGIKSLPEVTAAKHKLVLQMFGSDVTSHVRHSRLMDEFDKFAAKEGESLESVYERLTTLVNIMDHNNVRPISVSFNTKFLNCLQPEWSKYVTMVHHNQTWETVSDDMLYDSLVQSEPHVLASKAKKAAKNHDPLTLIAHSNASSSQSHTHSSNSPQPYYVTHPSSVVDYEDEYQGELQGDS